MAKYSVNIADAKRRFSEIVNEVVYHHRRYVISRHGKPVVGLIPATEMREPVRNKRVRGFLPFIGLWEDFEDLDEVTKEIYRQREQEIARSVPSLDDE
ncbi:MAG: type II toxin-antitoxin system Phd/YefM family antitoxin [Deltaproteobacteria bacterium]|nr:type II toxin-antitoxin system Phd/YefM family antitoxin [Deltaproteobacteria bacterium]